MSLANTRNYVAQNTPQVIATLSEFAQTDTLLFWHNKAEINALQQQRWQPILDKINADLNTVFKATEGLEILPQNKNSAQTFAAALGAMSPHLLTAVYAIALNLKSPLLAYAVVRNHISLEEAFHAAFLEELYQNQAWGEDVAALNNRAQIKAELEQIGAYLNEQMSYN